MISEQSNLVSKTMGLLFPIFLIAGFYVTINGHLSPGGGFQGGAIIASVFIAKYLMEPIEDLELATVRTLEKIFLLILLVFGLTFMAFHFYESSTEITKYFIITMNALIGLKVSCGMIIIFYRFAFYESR